MDPRGLAGQLSNVENTDVEPLGDLGDEANDMIDYQWKGPLMAAIVNQATDALIDPELLLYATQTPHGADGRVQTTIDRDLLGLFTPVEGRGHRDKQTCQEARNALRPSWPAIGEGRHPFFRWPVRLPIGSHSSNTCQPRRAASHPGPGLCGTSFVPSPMKKWLGV